VKENVLRITFQTGIMIRSLLSLIPFAWGRNPENLITPGFLLPYPQEKLIGNDDILRCSGAFPPRRTGHSPC
jgi:hypothetical protein